MSRHEPRPPHLMSYLDPQQTALTFAAVSAVCALYLRYNRSSIKDVRGPPNPSWIYGHQWYWENQDAGAVERGLLKEYGNIVRWNGPLGEERLWVADPKAINHILGNSTTIYRKLENIREMIVLIIDRGLAWADGETHRRQRKAMNPAFGPIEAKGLLPYFTQSATKLADKWCESITGDDGTEETLVIDMYPWFQKAALDAIGAGAFAYDFGALDDTDNALMRTYKDMLIDTKPFRRPPKGRIFVQHATRFLPDGTLSWLLGRSKRESVVKLRDNKAEAQRVARDLIEQKREELRSGTSGKDVLSLLVKAGSDLRPESRLTDEEIVAQVRTIMFAGHETTAKSLTFALWELAKNPDIQDKLRAEVNEGWKKVISRGDEEFVAKDFETMPYLLAIGKETLRVHPPVIDILRITSDHDVIPLSKPVVGNSGKEYNELAVPKGTVVGISPYGYNLNQDVWGADAEKWRPERWLEGIKNQESQVGVYGNLATFSGGVRACIGWRFAVTEIHIFLVTLIRQFEFALPDGAPEVKRWRAGFLVPVVEGHERDGPQLPLKVTLLKDQ